MKKYATGLAAILIAVSASAFTTNSVKDGQYHRDPLTGQIVPITQLYECIEGSDFCTFTLKEGAEDNGNPENYEGVGSSNKEWVPLQK